MGSNAGWKVGNCRSPTRRQRRPTRSHKIPAHSCCNQPIAACQHQLPSAFESLAVPSSDEPASNKEGQEEAVD